MLIRCPKCQTGFNLPVEKVPAQGAKLRCSACAHSFRVRVDEAGDLVAAEKVQPPPTEVGNRTQIGGLFRPVQNTPVDDDTPVESVSRSKSAQAGYNPFPMAGRAAVAEAGNKTQLLGSATSDVYDDDDDDSLDSIELFDADLDEYSEKTHLGPQASAFDDPNDRTTLDSSGRSSVSNSKGAASNAWDAGALDLFDNLDLPDGPPPHDLSDDFDPFGDAFSDVPDPDAGLLMPSTPSSQDVPVEPNGFQSDSDGALTAMTEQSFMLGGRESEFGRVEDLVDPSFGEDVATFDPNRGAVSSAPVAAPSPTTKGTRRGSRSSENDRPATKAEAPLREQPSPRAAVDQAPASRSAPRPIIATAPHTIGATSAIRRVFDVLFIVIIVVVAFVSVVAARAGGFVDFTRFGHMLEVAFEEKAFEPRPDWVRVVETAPAEPPPDDSLRLENVRASELKLGKERVLVITGKVRNYSNAHFQAVKIHAEVVDRAGEVVAKQTVPAGRFIDRAKVAKVATPAAVESLVEEKVDDVGNEGSIPFTVVFTAVPRAPFDAGQLDYNVSIAQ